MTVVNTYDVTFVNWDGSILQSSKVAHGEIPVYNGNVSTKDSGAQHAYTFTGWSQGISHVTSDIVYTAIFVPELRYYPDVVDKEVVFEIEENELLLGESTMDRTHHRFDTGEIENVIVRMNDTRYHSIGTHSSCSDPMPCISPCSASTIRRFPRISPASHKDAPCSISPSGTITTSEAEY